MNRAKLALLLLISFVATGSVVYQIRSRRPARGTIVGSPPQPRSGPVSAPGAVAVRPAPVTVSADASDAGKAQQIRGPAPNIPATGWGRNPFLTMDEINKMNHPEQPVAVDKPPQTKPQAEPPALPLYAVTGIISGGQGRWAILDGRLLRPGERIGAETLKEVRDRGVVLEHEGQMRELPLKSLEDTAAAAPPKKEAKP
jgi:hypothetical protein